MTDEKKSKGTGDPNREKTASPGGMPSSSAAEKRSTSDMSDTTAQQSLDFQPTRNSLEESDEQVWINIIQAFADRLGDLVEWRSITLKQPDGRKGYALFFPIDHWRKEGKKILVKGE